MEERFNLKGAERKELVRVMGEILEVKPKYLAMPTTNFLVDYFLVDKEGTYKIYLDESLTWLHIPKIRVFVYFSQNSLTSALEWFILLHSITKSTQRG